FVFWDPFMIDTSNELLNPVNLDCAHRGQLAELAFMRKAASLGFGVAKPWGEADRFDIIVRIGKGFLRVQVKSSLSTPNGRNSYRIKTTGGGGKNRPHTPYTADQIDFLVGYVFPLDAWYIFPVSVVENRKSVCVRPGLKKSKYRQYEEAWALLRPADPEPKSETLASSAAAGT